MVQFNFSYADGVSLRQMVLFETAGRIWGEYLADEVALNLHVGVVDSSVLPDGVIGGALPGIKSEQNYAEFRNSYQQNISSQDDQIAFLDLNETGAHYQFTVRDTANGQARTYRGSSQQLDLTRANAKALGIPLENPEALDGYIVLSNLDGTGVHWDENGSRKNAMSQSNLEMLSVALHEIGHTLGFVSALDDPNWLKEVAGSNAWQQSLNQLTEQADSATPMDFFRYSGSDDAFDLSYGDIGGEKYFGLEGGNRKIAEFATGTDEAEGGDGYQASHWKNFSRDNAIGIMDPALSLGERGEITKRDLRMFDVLGWELNAQYIGDDDDDDDDDDGGDEDNSSGGRYQKTVDRIQFLQTFENQYDEAEAQLARKLNISVRELWRNPERAEQAFTQNRDFDVFEMIINSQAYDIDEWNAATQGENNLWLAWRNWRARGGRSFWDILDEQFQSRGLYSTANEMFSAPESAQSQDTLTGLTPNQSFLASVSLTKAKSLNVTNDQSLMRDSHDFISPGHSSPLDNLSTGLDNTQAFSPTEVNRLGSQPLSLTPQALPFVGLTRDQLLLNWQDVGNTINSSL